jgi:hypothetical protein
MMSKTLIRLGVVLIVACAWFAVACVSALPPVDEEAFLTYLKSAQMPVESVTATNQCITINAADDIVGPAAQQLADAVFTGICQYAPGYRFTIQYPNGVHTHLKWQQLQAYCEGKVTIDQVDYVYYATPSDKTTCGGN